MSAPKLVRPRNVRHIIQLNGHKHASVNCGPQATRMGLGWSTREVRYSTVDAIRDRMGRKSGGTNPGNWLQAIRSYDSPDQLKGQMLNAKAKGLTGSWEDVREWLKRDRVAIIGVGYGTLRSTGAKVGSKSFSGWHAIALMGHRKWEPTGRNQVLSADSLYDGRYAGCPGPGMVWVRAAYMKEAAYEYGRAVTGKANTVVGVLVQPGQPVPKPPPPPEPDPEPEEPPEECLPFIAREDAATLPTIMQTLDEGEADMATQLEMGAELHQLLDADRGANVWYEDTPVDQGVTTDLPDGFGTEDVWGDADVDLSEDPADQ